jgi:hypothetical protein
MADCKIRTGVKIRDNVRAKLNYIPKHKAYRPPTNVRSSAAVSDLVHPVGR